MSIDLVVDLLRCPHCHGELTRRDTQVGCAAGHRFDLARQGYLNLHNGPPPRNADSAAMIADRLAVQQAGLFEPVLAELRATTAPRCTADSVIIDAGAGPGWYLAGLLDALPLARGVALDVSVAACRRAARAHPRAGAIVADTWGELPLRARCADVVISIFAPRNAAEFARITRTDGRVVIVAAGPDHLIELRREYGLLGVAAGRHADLPNLRRSRPTTDLRWSAVLSPGDVARVIMMGPNAFHRDRPGGDGQGRTVTGHVTIDELVPDR